MRVTGLGLPGRARESSLTKPDRNYVEICIFYFSRTFCYFWKMKKMLKRYFSRPEWRHRPRYSKNSRTDIRQTGHIWTHTRKMVEKWSNNGRRAPCECLKYYFDTVLRLFLRCLTAISREGGGRRPPPLWNVVLCVGLSL